VSDLGHICKTHREADAGEVRFRWGMVDPCGHEECDCAETGAVALYASLEDEDRWFGVSTLDPREDAQKTVSALQEAEDWPMVRQWLEADSALFGVPWRNVTYSEKAPRAVMRYQQIASLKTPVRFRTEPLDGLLALRRSINEYDPRLVLRLLEIVDEYASQTDGPAPTRL
jgi:hypothetical protein